ncbi:hypothetical protein [Joostella sp. CR20]|uniref:hypothetical protein n=1 Tax=Joostella sp. CR20 TaxID=2804312 RepID=UPI00313AFF6E
MKFWKIISIAILGALIYTSAPVRAVDSNKTFNHAKNNFPTENISLGYKYLGVGILNFSEHIIGYTNISGKINKDFGADFEVLQLCTLNNNVLYVGYKYILTHLTTKIIIFPFHFFW